MCPLGKKDLEAWARQVWQLQRFEHVIFEYNFLYKDDLHRFQEQLTISDKLFGAQLSRSILNLAFI